MFDISDFKIKGLSYGGSRPNLFEVTISFTDTDDENGIFDENITQEDFKKKFKYLCNVASLPGQKFSNSAKVSYLGRSYNFRGDKTFTEFSTNFLNDEDFYIRNGLELWMEKINSTISNKNDVKNYKSTVTVTQYSKDANPVKKYNLYECFPSTLGDVGLNYSTVNNISSFNVTWIYDYFTTEYVKIDSTSNIENNFNKING